MMLGKPGASGAPFRILPLPDPHTSQANDGPVALLRTIGTAGLRHKGKLAVWVALCLGAAFAYVRTTPPTYTASATVLLEPRRQGPSAARETAAPSSLDLNAADSELQVIRSERLLSTVFDALALGDQSELGPRPPGLLQTLTGRAAAALRGIWTALTGAAAQPANQGAEALLRVDPRRNAFENFARRFSARRVGQSYVLEIAYSSADPELPARVANAAASAYLLQSVAFKADAARSGAEFLQGRLDALAAQVRAANAAVRGGALPAQPIPDADARIIGAAQAPLGPSAPHGSLIMAFAGVFGLLTGVFVAALVSVFDRRVRSPQDLARETGLSCLVVVPEAGGQRGKARISASDSAKLVTREHADSFAAAIRDLGTAIEIAWAASRSEGRPVVAIGSWRRGAGAALLTMNLAQLLNHRGRQVSVFSADASPARGEDGGPAGPSLTDVIASSSAVQAAYANVDGVRLIPIRSATPQLNRFVDFRDPRAALVISEARQRGEVLIDLPPLGEPSDAVALATHADIVVLVGAEGKTTYDELNDALAVLQRAGVTVIGAAINRGRS
ncbi:exopolysaccharide biosynthesis protein [Bosea sp. F3-2]|uniref:Wzz/FepE/Etk N-terminal domain-containing protein n=1 Tax=Bosea sp. F3-2 TaxID=2599640 RepID=UPI0011ECDA69|nr:Wzz/FepE/Etk N-terminal domain-containing protein [Bosea sp. F3-2]QEL23771.1 exopolysaccharide biosynthesis protein [Bosea sp. F3-2]